MLNFKKIHFNISERKILLRIIDLLAVFLGLNFVAYFFDFQYFKLQKENYYWFSIMGIYLLFFGEVYEMYDLQTASSKWKISKSVILTASFTFVFYLLTPIFTPILPTNRIQLIYLFFSIFSSLLFWRLLYSNFFATNRFVKNVILICNIEDIEELKFDLESADPNYKIKAFVAINNVNNSIKTLNKIKLLDIQKLETYISKRNISEIIIASEHTEGITNLFYNKLLQLLESGVIIKEYVQVYEDLTQRIPIHFMARDFYRYFPFSRRNNMLYLLSIRALDIIVSSIGILLVLVLIPFIIVGNIIGNKGSLLYSQERVGKNGVVFKIWKFRSMVKNAETNGAVFAVQNDSRITMFGKFLRKSRADEFPQFINILKGEMALIGPRPERPFFVNKISEEMPFYDTRHIIKPGLTGWAQINYSYGDSIEDSLIKLQYDLYYIKHRSLFMDINIVIKTFSTVLFYRGQ
jgi:exopolysaccharide biosynthesis polyprenyl glycosylphosphotransferase